MGPDVACVSPQLAQASPEGAKWKIRFAKKTLMEWDFMPGLGFYELELGIQKAKIDWEWVRVFRKQ